MWHDVELRELRIFLVLADELHFGRTAERLGISQPGVSEAVRVLESRLGVKVFERTSRRVRLTPAGEELRRNLVPALAVLDQALAETSELSRAVRGLLRVGFVLTTEGPALSRLIAAFHARYPGCEARLQEVETFDAYRALRRGDIDVLCNWPADPPHPARANHQRDPLAGGPGPHRPPHQLGRAHLRPQRRRPHPDRRSASPATRAGLAHQPGEPTYPRPQPNRSSHDCGGRRHPCMTRLSRCTSMAPTSAGWAAASAGSMTCRSSPRCPADGKGKNTPNEL